MLRTFCSSPYVSKRWRGNGPWGGTPIRAAQKNKKHKTHASPPSNKTTASDRTFLSHFLPFTRKKKFLISFHILLQIENIIYDSWRELTYNDTILPERFRAINNILGFCFLEDGFRPESSSEGARKLMNRVTRSVGWRFAKSALNGVMGEITHHLFRASLFVLAIPSAMLAIIFEPNRCSNIYFTGSFI